MICPHCKTQWQLPAGSENNHTKCPFCNGDLYETVDVSYTSEMVLKEIVSRFGTDILSNSSEMIFAFGSVAPHLEKEIQCLLLFEACGGVENFLGLQGAEQEVISTTYTNQLKQMTNLITEICSGFLAATGISINNDEAIVDEPRFPNLKWEYVDLENNTIELTAYKGQLPTSIIFPSTIDDKQVVSIGSTILGSKTKNPSRTKVEFVAIPQGITTIKSSAFYGCKSLKEVLLPESLSFIGDDSFKNCKALTNIVLPHSLSYLGNGAFSGSGIQSIVLPGNIERVQAGTFNKCKNLTNITVLEGVTSIQEEAFYECDTLIDIMLPDSLRIIGNSSFGKCTSISDIRLPKNLTTIDSYSFTGNDLTTLTIPENVKIIKYNAFYCCWSLSRIIFTNKVVTIEDSAFSGVAPEMTIVCHEGSTAHKWAKKNNFMFEFIHE